MHELETAASLLRDARSAIALTGAGVSTPSGLPDFRSPNSGLWQSVNPLEVASIYGFRRDPNAFFNWIRPLVDLVRRAEPNPAHIALARLEDLGYIKALITQNIDLLHARAGSRNMYEVHGNIRRATCVECFRSFPTEDFLEAFIETGDLPYCADCGGLLKPNVILFGEQLPAKVLHAAYEASRECDLMLIAGSSLTVAPVSELPMVALSHGAQLIIVNDEATYADRRASIVIRDDVARILPRLVDILEEKAD